MRFSGQSLVQIALASLTILPNLITAQQDPRSYFTAIQQNNAIYLLGGSDTTLDVRLMNLDNGLNINSVNWTFWGATKDPTLTAYKFGVAYPGYNGEIFVQGGLGTTTLIENLVKFHPNSGSWERATTVGTAPPAAALMSASYNPSNGIAYYFGGFPLKNHQLDTQKTPIKKFSSFNTQNGLWTELNPITVGNGTVGRTKHSSLLINDQLFILGGQTFGANATTGFVEVDFESVLIYDINSNTAMSVTTLGDIPTARESFSAALGLDGHSIVIYGGYVDDSNGGINVVNNDVYVLDTCTLTWSKKSPGGKAPGALFGHGAITVNNYMVVTLGKNGKDSYNYNTYILDLVQWKWVDSLSNTGSTIASSTCKFALPSTQSVKFSPFNYDYSVVVNPHTPNPSAVNKKGFGIGFGIFAFLLIAGIAYFCFRRVRRNKKARTLNPRWMRNMPSHTNSGAGAVGNDRDYPLFVYNKELDNDNTNNPNRKFNTTTTTTTTTHTTAFAPNGVRTYTASDHDQWERQLSTEPEGHSSSRHSDIWQRMRGLNDESAPTDVEQQRNNNNNQNTGKLLDL